MLAAIRFDLMSNEEVIKLAFESRDPLTINLARRLQRYRWDRGAIIKKEHN